jgi:hypothetical protein
MPSDAGKPGPMGYRSLAGARSTALWKWMSAHALSGERNLTEFVMRLRGCRT